jgi:hypothetical protein
MDAMASVVAGGRARCRVSSVLGRDRALHGAEHMLPGADAAACWASDQGSPQRVQLAFARPVRVGELRVMFQGGFAGQDMQVHVRRSGAWEMAGGGGKDPEDSNELQRFPLQVDGLVDAMTVTFGRSTDFYGRVVVYSLDVLGWEDAQAMQPR